MGLRLLLILRHQGDISKFPVCPRPLSLVDRAPLHHPLGRHGPAAPAPCHPPQGRPTSAAPAPPCRWPSPLSVGWDPLPSADDVAKLLPAPHQLPLCFFPGAVNVQSLLPDHLCIRTFIHIICDLVILLIILCHEDVTVTLQPSFQAVSQLACCHKKNRGLTGDQHQSRGHLVSLLPCPGPFVWSPNWGQLGKPHRAESLIRD